MRYCFVNTNIAFGYKLLVMSQNFRDWIRALRLKSELTQLDFGVALSVSQTTVSQWESGRNKPTMPNLSAIAKFAGLKLEDIEHFAQRDETDMNDETKAGQVTKSQVLMNKILRLEADEQDRIEDIVDTWLRKRKKGAD